MTPLRGGFFVLFLAVAAYANAVPNGFAYDDQGIITNNPVVTGGDFRGAALGPWWQTSREGGGLYRPLTALSFTLEWRMLPDTPWAFHGVNVLVHGAVSVLLFLLLLQLGSVPGALAGGVLFAIHPLHTEAVANVVGRAELYAALFYLLACLLYWKGRSWSGPPRVFRLLGIGALYLLSLWSKEMGVTLPGVLLLLEAFAPALTGGGDGAGAGGGHEATPPGPLEEFHYFGRRVVAESPVYLLLLVVLAGYLSMRFLILGSLSGEAVAPVFQLVGTRARLLTAVALWGQYLRLLLFPLDLVSDYDPGVFFPSEGVDAGVLVGGMVLVILAGVTIRCWRKAPLVSLGILWFAVSLSPVSNLFFSTGTLLAERTLYIPSMGLSLVAAWAATEVMGLDSLRRRWILAVAALTAAALLVRTLERNPSWMSTFVVIQTLNEEHPESWRAFRGRAQGLERVGELDQAAEAWDVAVALTPMNYTLLAEAGSFHSRVGNGDTGVQYLQRAVAVAPELTNAYQLLSTHLLRRGEGRAGHRVALEGLAAAGPDPELWALVSESYLLKGDLPAAVRAREAAIGLDPGDAAQWRRMAEIQEAMGEVEGAEEARRKAKALEDLRSGGPEKGS